MRGRSGPAGRPAGLWAGLVTGLLVVGLTTGCIGAIPRDEFDAEVRSRSLSVAPSFPEAAVGQILAHTGGDELWVRMMSFNLGQATAVVEARNPAAPHELDRYVFANARLRTVDPVQLRPRDDLDEHTFPVASLHLDRLDEMFATALESFDQPDGEVSSVTWTRAGSGRIDVSVGLRSERARATLRFSVDGELQDGSS